MKIGQTDTNTMDVTSTKKTINYVSKYMTKKDEDNPDYISIILCSKGLGANYAKENQLKHRWNKEKTIITYKA